MLTVRVGKIKMARRQNFKSRVLLYMLVLVPAVVFITFILQKYSNLVNDPFENIGMSRQTPKELPKPSVCVQTRDCPEDHFSFSIQSGAANVIAPKICIQNNLVLGTVLNNAGFGINVVIMNGKTGAITKTGHFNMYNGDVNPLIEFLKSIETGSVVIMASYDDSSTKLNEDARKLIAELGSSSVQSLGFRDNWVFVGGKGGAVRSNFEKFLKNDKTQNKYKDWPEIIQLVGCIPKYLE